VSSLHQPFDDLLAIIANVMVVNSDLFHENTSLVGGDHALRINDNK
jgi:hypothetical protein